MRLIDLVPCLMGIVFLSSGGMIVRRRLDERSFVRRFERLTAK